MAHTVNYLLLGALNVLSHTILHSIFSTLLEKVYSVAHKMHLLLLVHDVYISLIIRISKIEELCDARHRGHLDMRIELH